MSFFLTILLIYSFAHLYIFLKIKAAFTVGHATALIILVFLAFMVMAPFLVRLSERHGFDFLARPLAYIGYTWMGLAFLFFSFSLVIDCYRILVYAVNLVTHRYFAYLIASSRSVFFIPLVITAAIGIYGSFEAQFIRNETVTIKSPKIPREIGTLTVAQISDVHLGLIVRDKRLKEIISKIQSANPDIIVSTGDLVDGQINNLTGLAERLQALNPPYGKFAVTGNHEFYAGLDQSLRFTERAGFKVLRGEAITVGGIITIAGVDDPAGKRFGLVTEMPEQNLLKKLSRNTFILLLKHRPAVDRSTPGLFDLQVSGHTHNGQIFPFSLVIRLFHQYNAGLTHLDHGSLLYVSRGSGTWGPPIRFLSPPEVTIIKLVHDNM